MAKLGPINEWFNTLRSIKDLCISHVIFNSNNNTIQVIEEGGTLILHQYSDNGDQQPEYQAQYYTENKIPYIFIQGNHELSNNEERNNEERSSKGNQELKRRSKKKPESVEEFPEKQSKGPVEEFPEKRSKGSVEKLSEKRSKGPVEELRSMGLPEGLPVEENLGSEEFEEESLDDDESGGQYHKNIEKKYHLDDKAIKLGEDLHKILRLINKLPDCPPTRDKKVFPRNELYRQAIINHLTEDSDFSLLKGFQNVNNFVNNLTVKTILTRIPFVTNDEKDIRDVLRKLAGHIFNSVTGSTRSKVAKDILRRKDLRFHVEVWKSYVCLQAFCSANLKRNKGETTRSQAKRKIMEEHPDIDLGDLDLILQISPRIYRLLETANGNWSLLDVFEEITPTFFKSKMKVVANFDLWLNLVRTGTLESHKADFHNRAKQELKDLKVQIIKSYFNNIDEEKLNKFVDNDD